MEDLGKFGRESREEFVWDKVMTRHTSRFGSSEESLKFRSSDDILNVVELAFPQVVVNGALLALE